MTISKIPSAVEVADFLVKVHRIYGWRAQKEALFSPRRIDVLAIAPGGTDVIGFEIKTSLSDLKAELNNPSKRLAVSRFCTQFYFVLPFGLISASKIPKECGVIYFFDDVQCFLRRGAMNKSQPLVIEDALRDALSTTEQALDLVAINETTAVF